MPSQSSLAVPPGTVVTDEQKAAFAADLRKLRAKATKDLSMEDFDHLRKLERWGRICSLLGYGTAWIMPNPISALLISTANVNRWANITHPISHGGYDKIKGIPEKYTSKRFAQGRRRFIDWLDWIIPAGWDQEHNQLHHYNLGEDDDPDLLERNMEWLRSSKLPKWARFAVIAIFACVWKPIYYAQSTLRELRVKNAKSPEEAANVAFSFEARAWSPRHKEGREYWMRCILPYAGIRFVAIPALFLPLGVGAATSVLLTSLLAEVFANLHSFAVIVPNHSGDDLARFEDPIKNKNEYYYRQVVGSVNFRTGSDLNDFLHGWLNYQVEHHLWPAMPLSQYQKLQPQVKALCEKHGIPYIQESVFSRVSQMVGIMTGSRNMIVEKQGLVVNSEAAAV
ncbi:MAG: fatty acid desaturase [Gammaproteobacteria bacterium]|nr:MAG: fatty acid desaturase [Gammaproteobacteria bacterium]